jgi:hypothetical protein
MVFEDIASIGKNVLKGKPASSVGVISPSDLRELTGPRIRIQANEASVGDYTAPERPIRVIKVTDILQTLGEFFLVHPEACLLLEFTEDAIKLTTHRASGLDRAADHCSLFERVIAIQNRLNNGVRLRENILPDIPF